MEGKYLHGSNLIYSYMSVINFSPLFFSIVYLGYFPNCIVLSLHFHFYLSFLFSLQDLSFFHGIHITPYPQPTINKGEKKKTNK